MSLDSGLVAWAVFLVFGAVSLLAAVGMTVTMSMYRAGLALMVSFLALAVLFVQLGADLLAVIQVMMNVAGMSVMILFMVMLMQDPGGEMMWDMARQMRMHGVGAFKMGMPRDRDRAADDPHTKMMVDMAMSTGQVRWALPISIAVTTLLVAVVARPVWRISSDGPGGDSVAAVGELLLSKYMIAFEGAALLILAGIVTAVMLGRREPADRARAMTLEAQPGTRAAVHGAAGAPDMAGGKEVEMPDESKKYSCPMHADVTSDKPGKCPKCGMALVAK
ncbi:MAG: NADH-quinone oxidoreductase subunit J [Candidatus Limnocylindria bacterium]